MLLSCGDALIDFLSVKSTDGRDALVPVVGGSCLNVAIGMARLGAETGFVGGLSTDLFGSMIAEHAAASQVDLRFTTRTPRPTTLAFVRTIDGEPHYAFYDEATASRQWTYEKGVLPFDEIEAIHLGSTTLVHDEGATQTLKMIEDADGKTTIAFDPNCRPNLVQDKRDYVRRMDHFMTCADIVRLSDSDFIYLYGNDHFDKKAAALIAGGSKLVIVTRGVRGAKAWHRTAGLVEVEAPQVDVVDTIGAGDSFQAALLVALRRIERLRAMPLAESSADELHGALSFAAACAAITCSRPGADPPRLKDVLLESLISPARPDRS
jgi:fructokinase